MYFAIKNGFSVDIKVGSSATFDGSYGIRDCVKGENAYFDIEHNFLCLIMPANTKFCLKVDGIVFEFRQVIPNHARLGNYDSYVFKMDKSAIEAEGIGPKGIGDGSVSPPEDDVPS